MIAEVIDPKSDTDEKILLTAKICPTKAIILEEEGTGKKIFPTESAASQEVTRQRVALRFFTDQDDVVFGFEKLAQIVLQS